VQTGEDDITGSWFKIAWLRNLSIYQEPSHITAPTRRSHPNPARPDARAIARPSPRSRPPHRHGHSRRATPIGNSYTVGQDINWKIECSNGTVKIYIDDVVKKTVTGVSSPSCFFKAGNYQQFSTDPKDGGYAPKAYSAVELRNLVVTHRSRPPASG
jgi:Alginate lyase